MKNKAILLVHGMGKHTAPKDGKSGSFGKEFADATNSALRHFAAHQQDKLEDHFDIHEFNFDAWLDERREEMANNAAELTGKLGALGEKFGASLQMDLARRITGAESKLGEDDFFYSHWLDVVFYSLLLGEKVRVDLAKQLSELVLRIGSDRVHIVAHSLGTAVVHDTLALLYRPADGKSPRLDLTGNKLRSVWMFANVSRLVNLLAQRTDPLQSTVRPGANGCTGALFNIRHKLDPFTWVAEFNPPDDGVWLPPADFRNKYRRIETSLVVEKNTHSFPQYLQDPQVTELFFDHLLELKFQGTADEHASYAAARREKSLQGVADQLEARLANLPQGLSDPEKFATLARSFKTAANPN